jgi:hypothetical protein
MTKHSDHYTNYTAPPIGSKLMISDFNVYAGEMCTVIRNDTNLIVTLDSDGMELELVYRNHFNIIDVPEGGYWNAKN